MSEVKVNKISPRSGTTVTLGDSGDTITLASGVSLTGVNATFSGNATVSGDLTVDTNTLYVDSINNRVGIGTTSPTSTLEVIGSVKTSDGGTQGISVASTGFIEISRTNGDAFIDFKTSTSEDFDVRIQQVSNGLRFETGGDGSTSERLRIDSSGNVLVGKSTDSFADVGVVLSDSQANSFTRNGANVISVRRNTSDGDIVSFYKDTTKVGSIGTRSSNLSIGSVDTGLEFNQANDIIFPANPSTNNTRDNAIDLGSGEARFKNLYLSGSVYLGGTGSANALDDYEEGTFTPTYIGTTSNPSVTYNIQVGSYTKIGRVVYFQVYLRTASTSSVGSGILQIDGLPFTSNSGGNYVPAGAVAFANDFGSDNTPTSFTMGANTSEITLRKFTTTDPRDARASNVDAGNIGTGSNQNTVILAGFYFTD